MVLRKAFAVFMLLLSVGAHSASLVVLSKTNSGIYEVDTNSIASPMLIGTVSGGSDLSGLVAVSGGRYYTIDRDQNALYTVQASDASVLSTVTLDVDVPTHPRGWAAAPDGTLYAVLNGGFLGTINPNTGATQNIAALSGVSGVEGLAFVGSTLYAVGASGSSMDLISPYPRSGSLFTINTSSGVASLIGEISPSADFDSLAYSSDGFLYSTDSTLVGANSLLWQIDPSTAIGVAVGNPGIAEMNGISTISVVPVPAAAWLFGSALFGLRWLKG